MKKFLIAWVFIFTISATAFAATSHDIREDIYLRQDLFEAKMDTFMAEIRLMNEQLRSEIKQEIQATNSRIDATNSRIDVTNSRLDDLYTMVYWGLALMGIILAFSAAVPYLVKLFNNIFQPRFTLEDVEKLIDAKLQRNNS